MKPPNPPNQPVTADLRALGVDDTGIALTGSESTPETRTTGSEGYPGEGPCRRCGRPIGGRRRNGYCSDGCRMADRRQAERRTVEPLFKDVVRAIDELRRVVLR